VSFFRTPVEAGYYKLALTLANLVQMPVSPLPQATYPELSREVSRKNWGNVRHILRQGSWLAGGYTLAAALGLLLLGRPLIQFLYAPEFLPAYPALLILLAGYLVANTFYWHRTALLSLGRPDFPTKLNLGLAVLKVAGILLLVPSFGYLANAALLAGSYLLGVSISALKVRSLVARQEQLTA
jgi:O-antigen/teichoic acid export membrane protein